jgi:hypothetical protein
MDVDYDTYAEARPGWAGSMPRRAWHPALHSMATSGCAGPCPATPDRPRLRRDTHRALEGDTALRLGLGTLAVINLVDNERASELSVSLAEGLTAGQLILNLRAEGPPEAPRICPPPGVGHSRRRTTGHRRSGGPPGALPAGPTSTDAPAHLGLRACTNQLNVRSENRRPATAAPDPGVVGHDGVCGRESLRR